ncbi:hypothetical protein FSP39_019342 [Pinctada imbricata]|uniref:PiggyBac transposable element-derived protein domain-containing protein n=1 Tax=Pinctada imbricata TaxID=66713 RepID=A0AA89CDH4_PINIB|nr:hypothetical protein FSP39_019342 [Pinctada imbricata]
MIAFTGRLGFKQYVPLKPTKRGIKVWMRADPHNGFVNEFQVNTGKEGRTAEKGLGERVVRDLSRSIWGNYHHIYCDNYFTSIQLFNDLAEQQNVCLWDYPYQSEGTSSYNHQKQTQKARGCHPNAEGRYGSHRLA